MSSFGVSPEFWRGRRVFLTGHTGFIGSWLGLWLTQMGAEVTGYALPAPTDPSHFESIGLAGDLHSIIGDVRELSTLSGAMTDVRPDIVMHLAAQPIVRRAYAEPVATFDTNVMGTVNLLQAARLPASVRAVVVFTTDKVYDNRGWAWGYRESDRLGGHEPYGASKACAELVIEAFRKSYFVDDGMPCGIASVRAGNVIGGGDWAQDRIVPDAIRAFGADEPLWMRNPEAVRPWQHVLEPISGCLMLAERLFAAPDRFSGSWNLGPDEHDARPVSWLVAELARCWGGPTQALHDNRTEGPSEARILTLSNAKAKAELGWRPAISVEEALALSVDWYRRYINNGDVRQLSLRQIELAMSARRVSEIESLSAGRQA